MPPVVMTVQTSLCVTFLSNSLRDTLDPRLLISRKLVSKIK